MLPASPRVLRSKTVFGSSQNSFRWKRHDARARQQIANAAVVRNGAGASVAEIRPGASLPDTNATTAVVSSAVFGKIQYNELMSAACHSCETAAAMRSWPASITPKKKTPYVAMMETAVDDVITPNRNAKTSSETMMNRT